MNESSSTKAKAAGHKTQEPESTGTSVPTTIVKKGSDYNYVALFMLIAGMILGFTSQFVGKGDHQRAASYEAVKQAVNVGIKEHGAHVHGPLKLSKDQRVGNLVGLEIAMSDGRLVPAFASPDGAFFIPGPVLRTEGLQDLLAEIEHAKQLEEMADQWSLLDEMRTLTLGDPAASKVVYITHDPFCPHCNSMWQIKTAMELPDNVRIEIIPAGLLSEQSGQVAGHWLALKESQGLEAAVLSMHEHESLRTQGQVSGISDGLDAVADSGMNAQNANFERLSQLGAMSTPTLFFKTDEGTYEMVPGNPGKEGFKEILDAL